MGIFDSKKTAEQAVGPELLAVLPQDGLPWFKRTHLLTLNAILMVPLLSSAAVGFDGTMMNGLQTLSTWRGYFDHPTPEMLGTLNAIFPVGKLLALPVSAFLADRFGRRWPLLFGFILAIGGAALQGASQNVAMFIVSRFILGAGTSLMSQPSPILITELAYPTQRGQLTALYNTFFFAGAIIAAWSTYGTFRINSTWSWRIPSLLQGAIPIIQLTFLFLVPESPRWLIANGREDRARQVLTRFHAGGDTSSPLVNYMMKEISENIRIEKELKSQSRWKDLFSTAANRRRSTIAIVLGFFAQWTGSSIIAYYLTLILNTIGITATADQALINGLLQLFNFLVAVFAASFLVDRVGRRTLFLVGTSGMLMSYIIWTILSSYFLRTLNEALGRSVVAFVFLFFFFYDIAWIPLYQAYVVEIFPYTLRSTGLTLSLIFTYIGILLGMFLNPIALARIGWRHYITFCCTNAFVLVIIYFLFPETKGRTLEQIAELFDGKKHSAGHVGDALERPDSNDGMDEESAVEEKGTQSHVEGKSRG